MTGLLKSLKNKNAIGKGTYNEKLRPVSSKLGALDGSQKVHKFY